MTAQARQQFHILRFDFQLIDFDHQIANCEQTVFVELRSSLRVRRERFDEFEQFVHPIRGGVVVDRHVNAGRNESQQRQQRTQFVCRIEKDASLVSSVSLFSQK